MHAHSLGFALRIVHVLPGRRLASYSLCLACERGGVTEAGCARPERAPPFHQQQPKADLVPILVVNWQRSFPETPGAQYARRTNRPNELAVDQCCQSTQRSSPHSA